MFGDNQGLPGPPGKAGSSGSLSGLTGIIDIAAQTTVIADGTIDDHAAIQTIIDASPVNSVFYFAPDRSFNLNGNNLASSHSGQTFTSSPLGRANIKNGGIDLIHLATSAQGLYFSGVSDFGVQLRPRHVSGTLDSGTFYAFDGYSADGQVSNCASYQKGVGILLPEATGYCSLRNNRLIYNSINLKIDMADNGGDYGDVLVSDTWGVGGAPSFSIRKVGGLRLVNCKTQTGGIGLDIVSHYISSGAYGVSGIYAAACSFEGATGTGNYDIHISADAGCSSGQYPKRLMFASCHAQSALLNKCNDVQFAPFNITGIFQQDVGATNVMRMVSYGNDVTTVPIRTGSGKSYLDFMINGTNGAAIKVGNDLTLFNSSFPSGKIL